MKVGVAARLIICILLLAILPYSAAFAAPLPQEQEQAAASPKPEGAPEISATSAILAETERGQVLFEKDSKTKLHIAPLVKLMTILIAIEAGNLSSNVTISKDSVDSEGSALSLEVGEKYTMEELLYGIMLTSANDAAKAVAEQVAGDSGKFSSKMNELAAKIGMKDTHFVNPTGLYDEAQYTTAYDTMLFLKYAIKNPEFNRIFSTQVRPWNHADGKAAILTSQNKLFWSYDGIEGGKTGYNNKDQQTVITTASRGSLKLMCIILDSPEKDLFNNAASAFNYRFDKFKKSLLVKKNDVLRTVEFEGKEINLQSTEDVYYVHPTGESFVKSFSAKEDLQQPLSKSKIAGTVRYILSDDTIIDINLYPTEEIAPPEDFYSTAKKKINENKDIFYLVVFLIFVEALLVLANVIKLFRRVIRRIFAAGKKHQ